MRPRITCLTRKVKDKMAFTYATVCSGVEGCSLALQGMDWEPIFFSEIEPFPCAVLAHHYPNVPNLGDMTKISYDAEKGIITNGEHRIQFHGRLDLLAGGTPCQDLSVAGKRAGAAEGSGTRSSLIWHFVRLIDELRPRVILWENVVGTFSSNNGRDFSSFVAKINELGYSACWRVLDAQYTRVDRWHMAIPQRRRRVWLVGCPSEHDFGLEEILFEPKSLVGDTAPRRRSREEVARTAQDSNPLHARVVESAAGLTFDATFGFPTLPQASQTLKNGSCPGWQNGVIALDGDKLKPRTDQRKGGNGFGINEENVGYDRHGVAYGMNPQGGDMHPCHEECSETLALGHMGGVAQVYRIDAESFNSMKSANPQSGIHQVEVSQNLDTLPPNPSRNQGGDMIVQTNTRGGDVMQTISADGTTQNGQDFVNTAVVAHGAITNSNGGDVMPTISANAEKCGGDNQTIFGGGYLIEDYEHTCDA